MKVMLQDANGKLAFRSQPKRTTANEWYERFAELIGQIVNVNGILYNVYGVGLTEAEKRQWLKHVREKPSNFQ